MRDLLDDFGQTIKTATARLLSISEQQSESPVTSFWSCYYKEATRYSVVVLTTICPK